jgi:hypothetical protein
MGIRALRIADRRLRIALSVVGLMIDGLAVGDWAGRSRRLERRSLFNRQSDGNRQSTIRPPNDNRRSVDRQSSIVTPLLDDPQSTIRNPSTTIRNG